MFIYIFLVLNAANVLNSQQLFPIADYEFINQDFGVEPPPFGSETIRPLQNFGTRHNLLKYPNEELLPHAASITPAFGPTAFTSTPPLIFTRASSFAPLIQPTNAFSFTNAPHHPEIERLRKISQPNVGMHSAYNLQSAEYRRTSSAEDFYSHQQSPTPWLQSSGIEAGVRNGGSERIEEKVVDKILNHLPKLAASFLRMGTAGAGGDPNLGDNIDLANVFGSGKSVYYKSTTQSPLHSHLLQTNRGEEYRMDSRQLRSNSKESGAADMINGLPKPSSIFSFGSLMSSMERQNSQTAEDLLRKRNVESGDGDEGKSGSSSGEEGLIEADFLTTSPPSRAMVDSSTAATPFTPTSFLETGVTPSMLMRLIQPLFRQLSTNASTQDAKPERRDASSVWTHSPTSETTNLIDAQSPSSARGGDAEPRESNSAEKPNLGIFENFMGGKLGDLLKSDARNSNSDSSVRLQPQIPEAEKEDPNLLKSLLSGKLNEVNWMEMILGGGAGSGVDGGKAEEGSALAQLFGKGGGGGGGGGGGLGLGRLGSLFGSGLDDDPSIPNKTKKTF